MSKSETTAFLDRAVTWREMFWFAGVVSVIWPTLDFLLALARRML